MQLHKKARLLALLLLLPFFQLLYTLPVQANGMPVLLEPDTTPITVPDANSKIAVLSEELTYDFRPEWAYNDMLPLVTVKYHLKNTAAQDTQINVAFLYLKDALHLQATWNGQEVPLTPYSKDVPNGWQPPQGFVPTKGLPVHWLDPATGEIYADKKIYMDNDNEEEVHTELFPLSIAGGGEGDLLVRYYHGSTGCDQCNRASTRINHYTYLLSPARYWSSFHDLTIKVIAPDDYQVASEPQLERTSSEKGEMVLTRHFADLPQGEFYVSVRNETTLAEFFSWPVVALFAGLGTALTVFVRYYKKRYH